MLIMQNSGLCRLKFRYSYWESVEQSELPILGEIMLSLQAIRERQSARLNSENGVKSSARNLVSDFNKSFKSKITFHKMKKNFLFSIFLAIVQNCFAGNLYGPNLERVCNSAGGQYIKYAKITGFEVSGTLQDPGIWADISFQGTYPYVAFAKLETANINPSVFSKVVEDAWLSQVPVSVCVSYDKLWLWAIYLDPK